MGEEVVCEETCVEQLAEEVADKAALFHSNDDENHNQGDGANEADKTEQALLNDDLRHPLDNSWDFWYLSADKVGLSEFVNFNNDKSRQLKII